MVGAEVIVPKKNGKKAGAGETPVIVLSLGRTFLGLVESVAELEASVGHGRMVVLRAAVEFTTALVPVPEPEPQAILAPPGQGPRPMRVGALSLGRMHLPLGLDCPAPSLHLLVSGYQLVEDLPDEERIAMQGSWAATQREGASRLAGIARQIEELRARDCTADREPTGEAEAEPEPAYQAEPPALE